MDTPGIKQLLQSRIFAHPSAKNFNPYSRQVLQQLSVCHTAQLGMHLYGCTACGHRHYQYHSCGNRHCPNCGGLKREQWLHDRMTELLPTSYFHVVFTLPQQLRSLAMGNRKGLFNLLFEASSYTLRTLGQDEQYLGGVPGIITVLHTNGQDLSFHPHVHCIVSGGGVNKQGRWVNQKRKSGNFLFPRRAMELLFKGYFLEKLQQLKDKGELEIRAAADYKNPIKQVQHLKWNVYAKAPFAGPEQIIEYLGRYTHKVAITSHRITDIGATHITFRYKDYQDGHKSKLMTLTHEEFLRRFEQHILPKGFVKIRHSGFLSPQNKGERLAAIGLQLKIAPPPPKVEMPASVLASVKYGVDLTQCSVCKQGKLELIATYINVGGKVTHLVNIKDLNNRGSPRYKPLSL